MPFDARAAKLLAPGQHLTIDEHPGLRMKATASFKTWIYRYKSPVDGRMRQVALGHWPAVSVSAAIAKWEGLRDRRGDGEDLSLNKKAAAALEKESRAAQLLHSKAGAYTIRRLCDDYLKGHIEHHRSEKGAKEVRRTFDTMLGESGGLVAADVTRAQAFNLISSYAGTPVQAGYLRRELGAAWDYGLDAGKLPESAPNWWRLILRGKLISKGKKMGGVPAGTGKRILSQGEISTLLRWLPNFTPLVSDVLLMYLWTMTRGQEIVGMTGAEVSEEPDGLWWTVPKVRTKNRRRAAAHDLRVKLFGRAEEIVRARMDRFGQGHLFPAVGVPGPIMQKTVSATVWYSQPYSKTRPELARERLPVTHWTPHDLRRTSRTLIASLGCPNEVGEALLGHMPSGIVGTYNRHTYDAERIVWLKRLSDHLDGLAAQR